MLLHALAACSVSLCREKLRCALTWVVRLLFRCSYAQYHTESSAVARQPGFPTGRLCDCAHRPGLLELHVPLPIKLLVRAESSLTSLQRICVEPLKPLESRRTMSMSLASPHVLAEHDLIEHERTREWASQIPPRVSTEHVRMLLVGERGGGKTTLWRNLLASYAGAQVCPHRPQQLARTHRCLNLPDASPLPTEGLRSQHPA